MANVIYQYALQNSYNYDAFGNSTDVVTSQTYNPFEYCGEYTDEETGFVYLRNRYYDPSMGRFITEDPAQDGLNWYVYCNSDPVNFFDPTGLIKEGDDELDEIIQIILNGENKDGSGGLSLAWTLANNEDRKTIEAVADNIREFDADSINRHMILLNPSEAIYMGHTATLLINEKNQGLLFSYYPVVTSIHTEGQSRITFLSADEWEKVLYNRYEAELITSNGKIEKETYTNNLYLTVSHDNGKNGLEMMAYMYSNPSTYNVAIHNCDHATALIALSADIYYDKQTSPSDSFFKTYMYHTNYWAWLMQNAFQSMP